MNTAQTAVFQYITNTYPIFGKAAARAFVGEIPDHTDPSFTLLEHYKLKADREAGHLLENRLVSLERRRSKILSDVEKTNTNLQEIKQQMEEITEQLDKINWSHRTS